MWVVKPKKHRDGFWRKCAESDEGGGFHEGCEHRHATEEEATGCLEAEVKLGYVTGFPHPDLFRAEMAYNGYAEQAGGKSLATGQMLPKWRDLSCAIQAGWLAAFRAVKDVIVADIKANILAEMQ